MRAAPRNQSTRVTLTPAEIAARHGVDVHVILAWIKCGELIAVNVARDQNGRRPRWRIDPNDLMAFENRRKSKPPDPPAPRRRKQSRDVIEFF